MTQRLQIKILNIGVYKNPQC